MKAAAAPSGSGPPDPPLPVWRVSKREFAELDGEGARLYGGRWNRPGTRIVYTSATLSLAALEYFVNLDTDLAPDDLVSVRLEVPRGLEIEVVSRGDLPADWRSYPAPLALQEVGTAWAERGDTPILSVPSVVVPEEWNYLLNPVHAALRRIRAAESEPFSFDPRMWR